MRRRARMCALSGASYPALPLAVLAQDKDEDGDAGSHASGWSRYRGRRRARRTGVPPAARIPAALHPHLQRTDLGVLPDPEVYMHGGTLTEAPGRRRSEGTDLVLRRK
jgi:hypothetical protein